MTSLPAELHGYHVHIYYDDATLPVATKLRDSLAANFAVQLGRNSGIAGPHPVPQMQVIFKTDVFQHIVPWLMFNREGLDILVHPLTDDEYRGPYQPGPLARYAGQAEARHLAARSVSRGTAAGRLKRGVPVTAAAGSARRRESSVASTHRRRRWCAAPPTAAMPDR